MSEVQSKGVRAYHASARKVLIRAGNVFEVIPIDAKWSDIRIKNTPQTPLMVHILGRGYVAYDSLVNALERVEKEDREVHKLRRENAELKRQVSELTPDKVVEHFRD